jgi:hypothetical protein
MYKKDARGQLWNAECSCDEFNHSNNRCVHVVVVCRELRFVDLETLMDGALPRRAPGRAPKENGCLDAAKALSKGKTAAAWLKAIRAERKMRFHRFTVVKIAEDGTMLFGFVRNGREGPDGKYIYICLFEPTVPPTETTVEWTDVELAQGLFESQQAGIAGQVPYDFGPGSEAPAGLQ